MPSYFAAIEGVPWMAVLLNLSLHMSSCSMFGSKQKAKHAPLRRCLQKEEDDDTACGEIALPYANHCLKRILPRGGRSLAIVADLPRGGRSLGVVADLPRGGVVVWL